MHAQGLSHRRVRLPPVQTSIRGSKVIKTRSTWPEDNISKVRQNDLVKGEKEPKVYETEETIADEATDDVHNTDNSNRCEDPLSQDYITGMTESIDETSSQSQAPVIIEMPYEPFENTDSAYQEDILPQSNKTYEADNPGTTGKKPDGLAMESANPNPIETTKQNQHVAREENNTDEDNNQQNYAEGENNAEDKNNAEEDKNNAEEDKNNADEANNAEEANNADEKNNSDEKYAENYAEFMKSAIQDNLVDEVDGKAGDDDIADHAEYGKHSELALEKDNSATKESTAETSIEEEGHYSHAVNGGRDTQFQDDVPFRTMTEEAHTDILEHHFDFGKASSNFDTDYSEANKIFGKTYPAQENIDLANSTRDSAKLNSDLAAHGVQGTATMEKHYDDEETIEVFADEAETHAEAVSVAETHAEAVNEVRAHLQPDIDADNMSLSEEDFWKLKPSRINL